jgi:hypothetical protein
MFRPGEGTIGSKRVLLKTSLRLVQKEAAICSWAPYKKGAYMLIKAKNGAAISAWAPYKKSSSHMILPPKKKKKKKKKERKKGRSGWLYAYRTGGHQISSNTAGIEPTTIRSEV